MRTRRPGIGRLPGLARSLGERDRAARAAAAGPAASGSEARGAETSGAEASSAEAAIAGVELGLGGLLAALRQAATRLGQATGGGDDDGGATEIRIGGQDGRVVFGYSVRGLDGGAEPFGNVAEGGQAPDAAAPRQPIVDLHADGADIVVIAELPGVDEAEISVALEAGALLITAAGWRKRLELPAPVRPDSLRRSCRNGILEVRLARLDAATP